MSRRMLLSTYKSTKHEQDAEIDYCNPFQSDLARCTHVHATKKTAHISAQDVSMMSIPLMLPAMLGIICGGQPLRLQEVMFESVKRFWGDALSMQVCGIRACKLDMYTCQRSRTNAHLDETSDTQGVFALPHSIPCRARSEWLLPVDQSFAS